jgi:hypothetical protein
MQWSTPAIVRHRRPLAVTMVLSASILGLTFATTGCQGKSSANVVAPKGQEQHTAAQAQETLPYSMQHDAARKAAGASEPGASRSRRPLPPSPTP